MTELFVIRHGETEWNIQHRFQGQQNSPLTADGRNQALEKQAEAALLRPDALYCSDLPRAMETAALLFPDLAPAYTPLLRELSMGVLEGLSIDDPGEHVELAHALFHQPEAYVPSEGAESMAQLLSRAKDFLALAAEKHPGERVAAISHGALIRALWIAVAGQDISTLWQAPRIRNLGSMRFAYDGAWYYLPEGDA